MTATGSFSSPTTHRMIDWVLRHTSAQWSNSAVPAPPGLAEDYVLMFDISHLADRGAAV